MSKEQPKNSSPTNVIDQIIDISIEEGASDIHIEPFQNKLRIRLRKDGVLFILQDLPATYTPEIIRRVKIMCDADIAETRRHQGGKIIYQHESGEIDIRVSTYVTVYGEKIVMRLMGVKGKKFLKIEQLGMSPKTFLRFREYGLKRPSGIIVVTGPTGSGKTNTVYSCIDFLNTPEVSILTAEEPVESTIDGICQCSINPKINLTFEETLRHVVRQDPDIVVIGEIRDDFSASVAVEASLTGHKVLTTFHTEDTIGTIIRLLNMNIEPYLISSTLSCVVAQRLVRTICPNCKQQYVPEERELIRLGIHPKNIDNVMLYKGKGCESCRNTGYSGRIGIFELLVVNDFIREAILATKPSHELRHLAMEKADLVTLYETGVLNVLKGITTTDEIRRWLPKVDMPRPVNVIAKLLL